MREQEIDQLPRRSISGLPFLVLWRARIKCADIDQMSSRPRVRVRVEKSTGERLRLDFPSRQARLRFFQLVKRADPGSAYTGSRPRHRRGHDRLASGCESRSAIRREFGGSSERYKYHETQNTHICNNLMAVMSTAPG